MSNGNLTATVEIWEYEAVRSIFGASTGKYYWEITIDFSVYHLEDGVSAAVGTNAVDLASQIGSDALGWAVWSSYASYPNGLKYHNGEYPATDIGFTTGDVVGIALDMDNGKLWFSVNGTWLDSGNPSTGTNAMYSDLSGTIYAIACMRSLPPEAVAQTANFGASAFSYSVPSGFNSGFGETLSPAPTITSIAPDYGTRGQAVSAVITGTDFTGATTVSFGTGITVNSFVVDGATQITASITVDADADYGINPVSVTTPSGTGTLTYGFSVYYSGGGGGGGGSETGLYNKGLLKILPETIGHITIDGDIPQYFFQWGGYAVIEPVPGGVFQLKLFVSDYPTGELTATTDYPTSLPDEFQPCVVDFACYVLSIRMKKWRQAARYYNLYINNLKKRKKDYMDRKAERRAIHALPGKVKYEGGNNQWLH